MQYDGLAGTELARRVGVPRAVLFDEISSTLDAAHELAAAGAPSGTIVLADAQTAGRGRHGRSWRSERGAGIWLTIIEQPADAADLEVLPLRVGIALAPALDAFAELPVSLKWPNDVYAGSGKLAGVLTEARWRGESLEWVAIGVGINVRPPIGETAAGLVHGTRRVDVLDAVVPAIREAARATGPLTERELAVFAARDQAVGKECVEPVAGRVCGIDPSGALLVGLASGIVAVRSGSLVLKISSDA